MSTDTELISVLEFLKAEATNERRELLPLIADAEDLILALNLTGVINKTELKEKARAALNKVLVDLAKQPKSRLTTLYYNQIYARSMAFFYH